jgi:hypothetical protein
MAEVPHQEKPFQKVVDTLKSFIRGKRREPSTDETWYTVGNEASPLTTEAQIHWEIKNVPPVREGNVRLYRGVRARALETEFAKPLTDDEENELKMLVHRLTEQERDTDVMKKLDELGIRALTANRKFYVDTFEIAQEYGKDGAVYYLDLPRNVALSYYRENLNAEVAIEVPYELAKEARLYARAVPLE